MSSKPDWLLRGRIKTRQIVLLVHLDEHRSVLRAAEAANMTQPAASKMLGSLESALGVALFERHARGVVPTWYGEILVRHARAVLADMSRAQDEITALKSGLSGQAAIGAVVNPATNLVPLAIGLLKQDHPQILVRVEVDTSDVLIRKLLDGTLDIAVARFPGSAPVNDLDFEALAEESHSVIARAGHRLAGRRRLRLKDLVQEAWILPPVGGALRERLNAMFAQERLGFPRNVVETASLPVITSLLQTTQMLAALQEEIVRPYCKAGLLTVLSLNLDLRMDLFGIVTRRERPMSPGGIAMLNALRLAATRLYRPSQHRDAVRNKRALALKSTR